MMTKEGSTKIVNFMTPVAGVLMLECGHISHIIFYSINIQHIDCYCVMLSYTMVDFHLFYDEAVDIQIRAPLIRSQCKVSDTQVTVKACGPLVLQGNLIGWSFWGDRKNWCPLSQQVRHDKDPLLVNGHKPQAKAYILLFGNRGISLHVWMKYFGLGLLTMLQSINMMI